MKKNFSFAAPIADVIDELAKHHRNEKGHGVIVSAAVLAMMRMPEEQIEQLVGRVVAAGYNLDRASRLVESMRVQAEVAGQIERPDKRVLKVPGMAARRKGPQK